MSVVAGINRFVGLFLRTFKQFGRGHIWLLLLLNFLLGWLVLYSLYKFYSPVFYTIVRAWTGLIAQPQSAGFTHYPAHFLLLPYFFGWGKFFVSLLVEGAILGAAAAIFYRSYVEPGERERPSFGGALYLWIRLVIGWLVINGLILLAGIYLPGLFESVLAGSPRRIFVFESVCLPGLYVVILSLFFFVIPLTAIHRIGVLRALGRSLRIFVTNPLTCLFLSAVILAVPAIMAVIVGQQDIIVSKFRPELVYWILLLGLVADIVVNFFWMGTAAAFLAEEE